MLLQVAVQTTSQALDHALVGTWALRGIALLTLGSFTTGVAMLLRVNKIDTLLCHAQMGVIARLERLEKRVNAALGIAD